MNNLRFKKIMMKKIQMIKDMNKKNKKLEMKYEKKKFK